MYHLLLLLVVTLCAIVSAKPPNIDTWGPAVFFADPSIARIVDVVTTIQPGIAPKQPEFTGSADKEPFLTIWPGMSTEGTGHLIQSTLDAHTFGNPACKENQTAGQWCIMASLYGNLPGEAHLQHDGPQKAVNGNGKFKIEYKLEANNNNWTQTVTDVATNVVLSTLDRASGTNLHGYGTGVECQGGCKGPIVPHYYFDTVITFNQPEPSLKLRASQGATYTTPISEKGGKVWRIAKMTIPAWKNPKELPEKKPEQ